EPADSHIFLKQITPRIYEIDLSDVTFQEGTYELRLNAFGSEIVDEFGHALQFDAFDVWTRTNTLPTADIIDISPDPRHGNVGPVRIRFSEPVSGVNVGDFLLERNTGQFFVNVSLAGAMIRPIDLDHNGLAQHWELDLSGVQLDPFAPREALYRLTLRKAFTGIQDFNGGLLQFDAIDDFTIDATGPRPDVINVSPDPRTTQVDTVDVTFDVPVTGVDASDFVLALDSDAEVTAGDIVAATTSGPVRITSAAAHGLVTGDSVTISGVQGVGTANGVFTITRVSDTEFLLDGTVADGFYQGGGRWVKNLGTLAELGGSVTPLSGTLYRINLAGITQPDGTYTLTLNRVGSGIARVTPFAGDPDAGALEVNADDSWILDATTPTGNIVDVDPDPRITNANIVTVLFTEGVTGLKLNEIQRLELVGNPIGNGTFTLTFNGETTIPLLPTATTAQVQAAL
ncbi:MAG: hypothetical protein ACREJB_03365, partial [Planctomycetaceae bacterium]